MAALNEINFDEIDDLELGGNTAQEKSVGSEMVVISDLPVCEGLKESKPESGRLMQYKAIMASMRGTSKPPEPTPQEFFEHLRFLFGSVRSSDANSRTGPINRIKEYSGWLLSMIGRDCNTNGIGWKEYKDMVTSVHRDLMVPSKNKRKQFYDSLIVLLNRAMKPYGNKLLGFYSYPEAVNVPIAGNTVEISFRIPFNPVMTGGYPGAAVLLTHALGAVNKSESIASIAASPFGRELVLRGNCKYHNGTLAGAFSKFTQNIEANASLPEGFAGFQFNEFRPFLRFFKPKKDFYLPTTAQEWAQYCLTFDTKRGKKPSKVFRKVPGYNSNEIYGVIGVLMEQLISKVIEIVDSKGDFNDLNVLFRTVAAKIKLECTELEECRPIGIELKNFITDPPSKFAAKARVYFDGIFTNYLAPYHEMVTPPDIDDEDIVPATGINPSVMGSVHFRKMMEVSDGSYRGMVLGDDSIIVLCIEGWHIIIELDVSGMDLSHRSVDDPAIRKVGIAIYSGSPDPRLQKIGMYCSWMAYYSMCGLPINHTLSMLPGLRTGTRMTSVFNTARIWRVMTSMSQYLLKMRPFKYSGSWEDKEQLLGVDIELLKKEILDYGTRYGMRFKDSQTSIRAFSPEEWKENPYPEFHFLGKTWTYNFNMYLGCMDASRALFAVTRSRANIVDSPLQLAEAVAPCLSIQQEVVGNEILWKAVHNYLIGLMGLGLINCSIASFEKAYKDASIIGAVPSDTLIENHVACSYEEYVAKRSYEETVDREVESVSVYTPDIVLLPEVRRAGKIKDWKAFVAKSVLGINGFGAREFGSRTNFQLACLDRTYTAKRRAEERAKRFFQKGTVKGTRIVANMVKINSETASAKKGKRYSETTGYIFKEKKRVSRVDILKSNVEKPTEHDELFSKIMNKLGINNEFNYSKSRVDPEFQKLVSTSIVMNFNMVDDKMGDLLLYFASKMILKPETALSDTDLAELVVYRCIGLIMLADARYRALKVAGVNPIPQYNEMMLYQAFYLSNLKFKELGWLGFLGINGLVVDYGGNITKFEPTYYCDLGDEQYRFSDVEGLRLFYNKFSGAAPLALRNSQFDPGRLLQRANSGFILQQEPKKEKKAANNQSKKQKKTLDDYKTSVVPQAPLLEPAPSSEVPSNFQPSKPTRKIKKVYKNKIKTQLSWVVIEELEELEANTLEEVISAVGLSLASAVPLRRALPSDLPFLKYGDEPKRPNMKELDETNRAIIEYIFDRLCDVGNTECAFVKDLTTENVEPNPGPEDYSIEGFEYTPESEWDMWTHAIEMAKGNVGKANTTMRFSFLLDLLDEEFDCMQHAIDIINAKPQVIKEYLMEIPNRYDLFEDFDNSQRVLDLSSQHEVVQGFLVFIGYHLIEIGKTECVFLKDLKEQGFIENPLPRFGKEIIRLDEYVQEFTKYEFIKDLTKEGIEPNPGPLTRQCAHEAIRKLRNGFYCSVIESVEGYVGRTNLITHFPFLSSLEDESPKHMKDALDFVGDEEIRAELKNLNYRYLDFIDYKEYPRIDNLCQYSLKTQAFLIYVGYMFLAEGCENCWFLKDLLEQGMDPNPSYGILREDYWPHIIKNSYVKDLTIEGIESNPGPLNCIGYWAYIPNMHGFAGIYHPTEAVVGERHSVVPLVHFTPKTIVYHHGNDQIFFDSQRLVRIDSGLLLREICSYLLFKRPALLVKLKEPELSVYVTWEPGHFPNPFFVLNKTKDKIFNGPFRIGLITYIPEVGCVELTSEDHHFSIIKKSLETVEKNPGPRSWSQTDLEEDDSEGCEYWCCVVTLLGTATVFCLALLMVLLFIGNVEKNPGPDLLKDQKSPPVPEFRGWDSIPLRQTSLNSTERRLSLTSNYIKQKPTTMASKQGNKKVSGGKRSMPKPQQNNPAKRPKEGKVKKIYEDEISRITGAICQGKYPYNLLDRTSKSGHVSKQLMPVALNANAAGSFWCMLRPSFLDTFLVGGDAPSTYSGTTLGINCVGSADDAGKNVFRSDDSGTNGLFTGANCHAKLPHSDGAGGSIRTYDGSVAGAIRFGNVEFVPVWDVAKASWVFNMTTNANGSTITIAYNGRINTSSGFTPNASTATCKLQGWNGTTWVDLATLGWNSATSNTSINYSLYTIYRLYLNITNCNIQTYITGIHVDLTYSSGSLTWTMQDQHFDTKSTQMGAPAATYADNVCITSMGLWIQCEQSDFNNQGDLSMAVLPLSQALSVLTQVSQAAQNSRNLANTADMLMQISDKFKYFGKAKDGACAFWLPNEGEYKVVSPTAAIDGQENVILCIGSGCAASAAFKAHVRVSGMVYHNTQIWELSAPPFISDQDASNIIRALNHPDLPLCCANGRHLDMVKRAATSVAKFAWRHRAGIIKGASTLAALVL